MAALKLLASAEEVFFASGNINVMILMRFIEGFLYNAQMSLTTTISPNLFPKAESDRLTGKHTIVSEMISLIIFGIALLDNGGSVLWRVVVLTHALICLVDAIIFIFLLRGVDSSRYIYALYGKEYAIRSASKYLPTEIAESYISEIEEIISCNTLI